MSLGIAYPDPITSSMRMVKTILIVLTLVSICALGFTIHYLYQENKKIQEEKGALAEKVTTLTHDIELIRVGTAAMELGQSLADKQKSSNSARSQEVRDKLKVTEMSIDNSTMTESEKVVAKSTARMDSIWEMYCQIQPNNTVCKTVINQGAAP